MQGQGQVLVVVLVQVLVQVQVYVHLHLNQNLNEDDDQDLDLYLNTPIAGDARTAGERGEEHGDGGAHEKAADVRPVGDVG